MNEIGGASNLFSLCYSACNQSSQPVQAKAKISNCITATTTTNRKVDRRDHHGQGDLYLSLRAIGFDRQQPIYHSSCGEWPRVTSSTNICSICSVSAAPHNAEKEAVAVVVAVSAAVAAVVVQSSASDDLTDPSDLR